MGLGCFFNQQYLAIKRYNRVTFGLWKERVKKMWDKWKKRIENFIWKEVEVEDEQEFLQQEFQDSVQDIKTRMTYQYPNNDSYHIPEISSLKRTGSQPKMDMDTPAYLRKGKRQVENQKQETSIQSDKLEETKVEKEPFKRTDVPSPVYGFRSRKQQKEVDLIPAFMRKQLDSPSEDVSLGTEGQKTPIITITQENTADEEIHRPEVLVEKNGYLDEYESTNSQPIDSTRENTRGRREAEKEKTQMKEPLDVKKSSSSRLSPFNVIMTPEDKQKLLFKSVDTTQNVDHSRKTVPDERQHDRTDKGEQAQIPLYLLNDSEQENHKNDQWILEQQQLLEKTLKYFHVRAKVVNATQGPAVTRFEVQPELGVKVSKVKNLSDDLKLNMSAKDIRIEAPIPGKNTIGIEVPNPSSQMVSLQEIIGSDTFQSSSSPLTVALGLNIEGAPIVTNIQKMPHGLIAGATGSGKSVCINTILLSLIYKASYEDVKFLLIDPKMVELSPYNGIPHLVSPVITDVKAATAALKWAVNEMEERYERFVQEGVRDIERYNQKVIKQNRMHEKMPFIVIVIDELADLMMVSPQDVEDAISRIAQKARACGIHLLLATQRPSVDVLTGLIKANIPTRIAFSVSSQVDSRTIIDSGGAEKLLGKGDMLFIENGAGKSVRLQGPFVSDEEIERITSYVSSLAEPNYLFEQETLLKQFIADEEEDELLPEAIQFVFEQDSASTSLLQRHFKIGYNRAARLMDTLENKGIISGQNGSKPRDVLITRTELEEILDMGL
ncbi:DNA translocase FtsK [Ornithinibacillus bavariensis]|uniref:DNA translocase FtsK n=2 Tax=Ornithinibacillus bavariensis TaxID=545502 RepID=A0A920C8K9_9BACI|nr:DNA translocase FtsK [Ornithinibacillus bavariensis]